MRRRWTVSVLLALCLCLPLVGAVLAQDTEPSNDVDLPPEPPVLKLGVYVTSEDNENNAGTGAGDDDMGMGALYFVCPASNNVPIEFNIVVGDEICSAGQLSLAAIDFESGLHEVYVNGHSLGTIPEQEEDVWEVEVFNVPQAVLKQGANLVEIEVIGDCGAVAWGALAIEPCQEEFVPEPGSVMLLGGGLMGLAGYATLRWRSRQ